MCEYACFSCIFLSSFTHGMGIYLLLLSFNSVADLRCVIIDEAQPRGVLLRIKGTARRAVTWHHADVSLHRTQYQNLFHPGHGASATGNIVFPANDTRPESSHAPDCEPPAQLTRLALSLAKRERARPPRASRPTGTASVTPACAAVAAGICHVKPPAPGGCFPGGKRRRRERRPRPAPRRRRRPRVMLTAPSPRAPDHTVTRLDLSRLRVWCEMPPINGCARRGTSVKGDL